MKSFFRGLEMRRRESSIKDGLMAELMTSVKSVQFESNLDSSSLVESESSLCIALEAIFIHGLKENLVDKMASVLGDPDQRPSPDFWSMLMVFSHSTLIRQISLLSQITTDIGRSRAWLRITLNEGLLTSYLQMMVQDNSALNPYYKQYAFFRDIETLSIAINVLLGLRRVNFSLPVNSSMLNTWPNPPLLLAGLWTPPMKEAPVSVGTDIVKGIVEVADTEENISILSFPSSSGRLYEEEEALKIILGTPIEGSPLNSRMLGDDLMDFSHSRSDVSEIPSDNEHYQPFTGNEEVGQENSTEISENVEKIVEKKEMERNSTLESYHKIIDTCHDNETKISNLEDIIEKFRSSKDSTTPDADKPSTSSPMQKSLILEEYEVIEKSSLVQGVPEFKFMVDQLGKLMHERGLIEQNFSCKECRALIGFSFAKAWVCSLTGCYYCKDCFKPVECVLPAKILHNWDFAHYSVSQKAASFLKDVQEFPLFNVRKINPDLYQFFPEMLSLQKLRLQMNYIRSYLFTCQHQTKERIKQMLWPREYLYEHVHLYAIADLMDIPSGKLEDLLKRAIRVSTDHILSCQLCSQKGYICEICKHDKVIYPFDIDSTFRCPNCRTVYHIDCRKNAKICRKCNRIKERNSNRE